METTMGNKFVGLGLVVLLAVTLKAGQRADPAVDIQNQVFDPNTGVLIFDLVNHSLSALPTFTYEVRYVNPDGDPVSGNLHSEDFAGMTAWIEAVQSVGLSTHVPEETLPIPPGGRRTFTEELGAGSTKPTVFVHAALFADGTSHGNAEAVRQFKRDRVKKVEHLGLYIAALRIADKATERSAMFAALDSEANARPAVRDSIREAKAGLQQMPGDVRKNLRDMITIAETQRASMVRGQF
jgi:hypothetical protein